MDALLKDALICLTISVVASTVMVYKGISYLKEDADASDSKQGKGERGYSVWSVVTGWIMLVIIIFCSIFFPSKRYI